MVPSWRWLQLPPPYIGWRAGNDNQTRYAATQTEYAAEMA
jgi:hypothetical protein